MKKKKERIDVLLVKKNFINSREKAKKIIMTGTVFVDNHRVDKPGTKIDINSEIIIKNNPIRYVGRGGLKLEKALEFFSINIKDKVAMDIGSSTGGFTDCMLQNGAEKVYAVDVGYGQLAWKIRTNEKVVVMERTNIRYVEHKDIGEYLDFATIDVSFISLELVLPVAKKLLKENAQMIALIKPQFEAGRDKVGKKGVVRNIEVHLEVVRKINRFCGKIEMTMKNLTYSPIKGAEGNIEYLAYIENKLGEGITDNEIEKIIKSSHQDL